MDNKSLVADLVDWVSKDPRPYREVMDTWRTSCPRLSVWEDAVDHDLVQRRVNKQNVAMVHVTDKGEHFLKTLNR